MFAYLLLMVVVLLTQYGDYWSTNRALGLPGVYESNPLVREVGLVPLKIITSIFYSVVLWFAVKNDIVMSIIATGLLALFYGWVVWNNISVFERYHR